MTIMNLEERIRSFARLGDILNDELNGKPGHFSSKLNLLIENQHIINPWFTPDNVKKSLRAISEELTENILSRWTGAYPELKNEGKPIRAGIIMAGNIPLVGFHDFLCVLISGNMLIAKTSSRDPGLIPLLSEMLCTINPEFRKSIEFTQNTISDFDVVIATGSNNSSRYFEYYFGKYPHIIRKNRTSIAILQGNESQAELSLLGDDIFSYFGLGCRNVSKIFIPEGYDTSKFSDSWSSYSGLIRNSKYANNYDFNKAVYQVNKENFIDLGYLLLKEDPSLSSPVSVLYYQNYDNMENLMQLIENQKSNIQCIVGRNHLPFGTSQAPHPWDYSDGIDTLDFLLKKKVTGKS